MNPLSCTCLIPCESPAQHNRSPERIDGSGIRGRGRWETHLTELEHDLPDSEIVQSRLSPNLREKQVHAPFLAELGLDVQVATLLPVVHEMNDVIGTPEGPEDPDLLQLPVAVPTAQVRTP